MCIYYFRNLLTKKLFMKNFKMKMAFAFIMMSFFTFSQSNTLVVFSQPFAHLALIDNARAQVLSNICGAWGNQ